ncbi:MAG TPA: TPM domain-containing protein [Pyrinomonadaceae bacterium]|nr:TPM domain-containing protein [Pyrinomonadaceae bacterium]
MTRLFALAKLISVAAALLLLLAASPAYSQNEWNQNASPLPTPTGPVNDYAGVIDQSTKDRLDKRLVDYQRSTGVELAVAVVKTTGDRPIFDYSLAVARGWGIGSKADDNPSALLFVAVDDRKYFTQVSRNLEDELPDGLVGSLQRQYLVPEFRKQNYAKGIEDTLEAYIRTIEQRSSGTASPTPVASGEQDGMSTGQAAYSTFCCLLIIFVIIIIIFANRGGGGRGKKGWGGSGGFGGGGSGALPWIIGSAIGSAIDSSSSSSSSSDWGSGWSSGGGGGSDWGGFGGGGDFGGGGAGGDW